MKSVFFVLSLCFINLTFSQVNQEAINYNDYFVGLQNQIGNQIIIFNKIVGEDNSTYEKVNLSHLELIKTVDDAIIKAEKVKDFLRKILI